jgi:hypothetical protein
MPGRWVQWPLLGALHVRWLMLDPCNQGHPSRMPRRCGCGYDRVRVLGSGDELSTPFIETLAGRYSDEVLAALEADTRLLADASHGQVYGAWDEIRWAISVARQIVAKGRKEEPHAWLA